MSDIIHNAKGVLGVAKAIAGVSPIPQLQTLFELASDILDTVEQTQIVQDDCDKLASRVCDNLKRIAFILGEAGASDTLGLISDLEQMQRTMEKILEFAAAQKKRKFHARWRTRTADTKTVGDYTDELDRLFEGFTFASLTRIRVDVQDIRLQLGITQGVPPGKHGRRKSDVGHPSNHVLPESVFRRSISTGERTAEKFIKRSNSLTAMTRDVQDDQPRQPSGPTANGDDVLKSKDNKKTHHRMKSARPNKSQSTSTSNQGGKADSEVVPAKNMTNGQKTRIEKVTKDKATRKAEPSPTQSKGNGHGGRGKESKDPAPVLPESTRSDPNWPWPKRSSSSERSQKPMNPLPALPQYVYESDKYRHLLQPLGTSAQPSAGWNEWENGLLQGDASFLPRNTASAPPDRREPHLSTGIAKPSSHRRKSNPFVGDSFTPRVTPGVDSDCDLSTTDVPFITVIPPSTFPQPAIPPSPLSEREGFFSRLANLRR